MNTSREDVAVLQEIDRRLAALRPAPYSGTPAHPYPPIREEGWEDVRFAESQEARERAASLAHVTLSGQVGGLDVWHYQDAWLSTGLHRFFRFATPVGTSIGAIRYAGVDALSSLGAPPPPAGAVGVDPTVAENACTSWSPSAGNSDMDTYAAQINDAGPSEGDRAYVWYERALYRFTSGTGVTMPGIMGTRVDKCGGLPANWVPPSVPTPTPTPGGSSSTGMSVAEIALIVVSVLAVGGGGYLLLTH